MPMYNLPDVYSTTSTVPSTANLQVVAACSVLLSVNTGQVQNLLIIRLSSTLRELPL
jgi:hypothetical protein